MSAFRYHTACPRARAAERYSSRNASFTPVAALLTLVWHGRCDAQCDYEATIIEPRPCPIFGILPLYARGVSHTGQVVGWRWNCDMSGDDIAYSWTAETGFVDIPFPAGTTYTRAEAVNSTGRIVGSANFPNDGLAIVGFVYDWATGRHINLGVLPGANWSEALAVNEAGQVVGYSHNNVTGDPPFTAFLWQDDVITPLSLPLGPHGVATDIDDLGRIVGWMGQSTTINSHAFIWQAGVATDLGNVPGAFASQAMAINCSGQVLVVGLMQEDEASPVRWNSYLWDEGRWTNLGHLSGFDKCAGLDVNDAGQVVGWCTTSAQPYPIRAFLWQDGVMMRLDDLVATPQASVAIPEAINQAGQIAAIGGYQDDPAAVLLRPLNQPVGDVNHDCSVGLDDLLLVLDRWGPCSLSAACAGDVDGNGSVDVIDLLILLANWGL